MDFELLIMIDLYNDADRAAPRHQYPAKTSGKWNTKAKLYARKFGRWMYGFFGIAERFMDLRPLQLIFALLIFVRFQLVSIGLLNEMSAAQGSKG